MKNIKKLFLIMLVLSLLVPLAISCDKTPDPIVIAENGATEYILISPVSSSKTLQEAALNLRRTILEKTDIPITRDDDWIRKGEDLPETAKEILIGTTNRNESKEAFENLREKDFVITYKNERIIIIGGSDEATAQGAQYFVDNYIDEEKKTVFIFEDLHYLFSFDYPLGYLKIDDVDIKDYQIVYPKDGPVYDEYAATFLARMIQSDTGYELTVVDDSAENKENEILIGVTNRAESKIDKTLTFDQYLMYKNNSKVILVGHKYIIGAAVAEFMSYCLEVSGAEDQNISPAKTGEVIDYVHEKPKNAILLIGDGMGFNHIELGLATTMTEFYGSDLPYHGDAITDSKSGLTDSAAAGTALSTGYKTKNAYIGMDEDKNVLLNLRELAHLAGAKTAVLTTDDLAGATPGAFLAHHHARAEKNIINEQIKELRENDLVTYAKGSVGNDLFKETKAVLDLISSDDSRFFMMMEEDDIDVYSHANNLETTAHRMARFNEAIAYTLVFAASKPGTILIITADHETGGLKIREDEQDPAKRFYYTTGGHTRANVPVFALGYGTEYFHNKTVDNTEIAKFISKVFTTESFGQAG